MFVSTGMAQFEEMPPSEIVPMLRDYYGSLPRAA